MGAFMLETLEKSCFLDSVQSTEVPDTLMQYESFCYCLSQLTFHIAIYEFFFVMQVYAASFNLYWLFLAKWFYKKKGFL